MLLTENNESKGAACSPQVRVRLLEQMADALEDEAAMLYRRAAAFEEDEFLLTREIEQRQTEINRLQLKLDAMRAERDRVIEKIESISEEVEEMRHQAFTGETPRPALEESTPALPEQGFFRRASIEEPRLA
jgi:predicted RNase H-like nuclease (RuvC/YqgF family)